MMRSGPILSDGPTALLTQPKFQNTLRGRLRRNGVGPNRDNRSAYHPIDTAKGNHNGTHQG